MLRAIHLKRFGMFSGRSFALGPVTVFGGANQSGKSTVFDAIRIHAFRPDKRRRDARALYARYGDDTDVVLEWDNGGAPPEMGDAEFMNLFAVGSGNLALDLDGDWVAAVKKSLFAGGIDPRNLVEEFRRLASEKGTYAHMRERTRLERERDEREARLEEKRAARDRILADLDAQAARRDEVKGLTARLAQLQGREQELAEEVGWQERIAERVRLEGQLALLDEIAELERRQQAEAHLAQDRTAELDALEAARAGREAERLRAEEAHSREQAHLAEAQAEAERLRAEAGRRRPWRRGIDALGARAALHRSRRLASLVLWGAAGVLAFLLGVLLLVLSDLAAWGWLALAVGGLLGVGVAVLPGLASEWLLVRAMKDEWRALLGEAADEPRARAVLESRGLDGVTTALAEANAALQQTETALAAQEREVETLAGRVEAARRELDGRTAATEQAGAALRDWLARHRVAGRDEYRDRLAEHQRVLRTLAQRYEQRDALLSAGGFPDGFHLRSAAERRLRELDEAHVPRGGLPEAQLQERRGELERVRGDLEQVQAERHRLDRESHGASERLVGRLGSLPEEIAALEEDLRRLNADIAAIELNRRAAERAGSLLEAVAADESAVLADLSAAVAETFGTLTGLGEAHEAAVAVAGLRTEDIRARDRLGRSRPVEHLSSGARHLLFLALRLEMARRERQGREALLCLDEPFAFLDPERQVETLAYLRRFLEETGWQLILFTNEPAQAERARAVFPDCRFHQLD